MTVGAPSPGETLITAAATSTAFACYRDARMPDAAPLSSSTAPKPTPKPNRRGRQLASLLFIGFSVVFVVLSTMNAVRPLFFGTNPSAPLETSCAVGLRSLTTAVDRALAQGTAVVGANGGAPIDAFEAALAPEWNDTAPLEARCSMTNDGANAFAATARYKTGAESAVRGSAADVLPLRSGLDMYISTK